MTRFLFALPLLAACTHTPLPCDAVWPRTCEERRDAVQADARPVKAERPVSPPQADKPADPKPEKDHSRDDNGASSETNGDDSHDD